MQIVPLLIATLIPLAVLYVMRSLDLYQTGNFKNVLLSFAWGCGAVWLALQVNGYLNNHYFGDYHTIVRFVAPVSEEILKALILIVLVRLASFTYFVDGSIYGFAAGMGFAVVENYLYLYYNPGGSMGTAISRVISVNLIHASATALVGIGLGKARFSRILGTIGYLLGGLALAMLMHGTFNNIVDRDFPGPMLLYSSALGFTAVGLIAFIIFRGLAEQRQWIEEKLGMADRVTDQEAKVVHKLADVGELLEPLRKQFGDEKADQVEKFLLAQAKLGIKRKSIEKMTGDPKMRAALESEAEKLQIEMNEARKKVGNYVMLSVRVIFPPETSPVWGLLEKRIQERIEQRKVEGGPKVNLFANLGQRMAEAKPAPDKSQTSAGPAEDKS